MTAQQKIEALIEKVIKAIEAGKNPFVVKPWDTKSYHNPISGFTYSGMNVMFLSLYNYFNNSYENRFATFKQLQDVFRGKNIQFLEKGKKGIDLFKYMSCEKKDDNGETIKFPVLNAFTVFPFNELTKQAQDVLNEKYPVSKQEFTITEKENHLYNILNEYIQRENIALLDNDYAAYVPSRDCLYMPKEDTFKKYSLYLSVFTHECAHSTAASKRLNRPINCNKESEDYAIEEVIAQTSAAFLLAKHGINDQDTESLDLNYLISWASAISNNKRIFLKTFSMIDKICSFIEGTEKK